MMIDSYGRITLTLRSLYRAHSALAVREFYGPPHTWRSRIALAVVRWALDRVECWRARHDCRRLRALRREQLALLKEIEAAQKRADA